jgi:ATP-dependent exoDNAse (exonuclease V) alpha subunit
MVSLELYQLLVDALPYPARVQFIFLGDLNQLPPVYGHPVLGQKLLELPIVELTQVYRQALESPIISLALAVKNNDFRQFNKDAVDLWTGEKFRKNDGKPAYMAFNAKEIREIITLDRPGRGKVTLHPWKKKVETEVGLAYMQGQLKQWIKQGVYDPMEDLVLCPWNKSFGTDELNRAIADKLGKDRGAVVHEVIAGFTRFYYAIGDKLMVDKQEALIVDITKNPKYLGKRPAQPSEQLDRWGNHADRSILASDISDADIDAMLDNLSMDEERTTAASHIIKYRYLDGTTEFFMDKAAELNATSFGYAITVHKAQGSECRKVFVLTHYCHSAMLFRELIYTAVTRAAEELYIVMSPMMLATAADRPRIHGDTLQAKLEFYKERLKERISNDDK